VREGNRMTLNFSDLIELREGARFEIEVASGAATG
jgi:hypothetical protein